VTLTSPPLASVAPGGTRAQGRSARSASRSPLSPAPLLPAPCSCGAAMGCETLVMASGRPRGVEIQPFPSNRRLVTAAMRAGRRMAPMYGLVDVDVTRAKRLLASHDPPSSLTAFVVASVARVAAAHPAVHAYRNR